MKNAIRNHLRDFLFIVGLIAIASVVATVILSNQRLYLPKWVPGVGTAFVDYQAELETAKSLSPGQGQTVTVAGVPVGEVGDVKLERGRAIVTLRIREKYASLYRDAVALVRPKTGLEDMTVELAPGNRSAGVLRAGGTIPVSQTAPTVQFDEILSTLDKDTRDYLVLLIGGGAEAVRDNDRALSETLRRFEPTTRDIRKITGLLSERTENIRRVTRNFRLVAEAIGEKDQQVTQLVEASNEVFSAFAAQDENLRATIRELPGGLKTTRTALAKLDTLATELGPTTEQLRPGARALAPTSRALQQFAKETTSVVENELRPFARDVQPAAKSTEKAAGDLAAAAPALDRSLGLVNELLNGLTYNPPGKGEEGYLFWVGWLNHIGTSLFQYQDGQGPARRGLVFTNCGGLRSLQFALKGNKILSTIGELTNTPKLPSVTAACP